MRDTVLAEDGDEVSVVTTAMSLQQELIQIEIENKVFDFVEIFSLTPERARELAQALATAADVVERLSVGLPPLSLSCFTNSPGNTAYNAVWFFEQDMVQDNTLPLEARTSRQLAEIVASRLKIPGAFVSVCSCNTLGWSASVITRSGAALFTQQLVDEIASELRKQYSLQTD